MFTHGLIPAHAGKTERWCPLNSTLRAHPRSRGENGQPVVDLIINVGSSPLTRGKRLDRSDHGTDSGLIPAHAGKTSTPLAGLQRARAHPRSRGENSLRHTSRCLQWGSSPLTRGKQATERECIETYRLIPAHAGKTILRGARPPRSRAHPRSRGENTARLVRVLRGRGSSPLTRGKRRENRRERHARGLIPAHAGKTAGSPGPSRTWGAHPRSRGENR